MKEWEVQNVKNWARNAINRLQDFSDRYFVPKTLNKPYPYLAGILAVGLGVFITHRVSLLGITPSLFPLVAVIFTAWYGGLGPSLFATLLAVLGYDYYILDPKYQFDLGFSDLPPLLAFSFSAILAGSLVSSLRRSEELLAKIALQDTLTGLPNRKLLQDRLETSMSFALRNQRKVAVVFLDIDNFKEINDKWGHRVGDDTLKSVAVSLRKAIRDEDTISRWGGDEFVIIFPDLNGRHDIETVMEKIFSAFYESLVVDGKEMKINVSCGVSLYPDIARESSELIRTADEALYKAKGAGKNRYQIFEPETGVFLNAIR